MKIRLYYDSKIPKYGYYPYKVMEVSDWEEFWDKWYRDGDFIYCGTTSDGNKIYLKKTLS